MCTKLMLTCIICYCIIRHIPLWSKEKSLASKLARKRYKKELDNDILMKEISLIDTLFQHKFTINNIRVEPTYVGCICKCSGPREFPLEHLLMINHGINFTKYNNTDHTHTDCTKRHNLDLSTMVPTDGYLYAYSHQKMQSTKWIQPPQTHYHKLI